jgi:hypothetical protein
MAPGLVRPSFLAGLGLSRNLQAGSLRRGIVSRVTVMLGGSAGRGCGLTVTSRVTRRPFGGLLPLPVSRRGRDRGCLVVP